MKSTVLILLSQVPPSQLGLYKELVYLKKEAKHIKSNNPIIFITILINLKILVIKHKFKLV
jgi:hypothetical protein